MYGFAPVTLVALRRADPDRPRPYRLPAAEVIAPLAFAAANLIIYWPWWTAFWKLLVAIVLGLVFFGVSFAGTRPRERPPLDLRSLGWMVPWLAGMGVISY